MINKPMNTLEVVGVSKRFGDTQALDRVSLVLKSREIHGLVGHNGAGKSTLLRVFSGAIHPDGGALKKDGIDISFNGPASAIRVGIATVYQELTLLSNLTIAENTFLGNEITHLGRVQHREMIRETEKLLARFELNISPNSKLGELSVAQRQLVEIAVAVHRNADFLLLDEPTTSLEASLVEHTLNWLVALAERENVGILFVGHKIDELIDVSHRITVLADGVVRLQSSRESFNRSEIVDAVIGASSTVKNESHTGVVRTDPVGRSTGDKQIFLNVKDLKSDYLSGISLAAYKKRILGIYGLVGSGRSRFLRTLIGIEPMVTGSIRLKGSDFRPHDLKNASQAGVVFVTEDRKTDGFIPQLTAKQNVMLPVLDDFISVGWLNRRRMGKEASALLAKFSVKGNLDGNMVQLSGGNQQKVLFARAIRQEPRLLLLDEPTKGVDIGAKNEIYNLIRELTQNNDITVIMVSSEEQEILRVSDDVAIFLNGSCDGRLYDPNELDEAKLRKLAWYSDDLS